MKNITLALDDEVYRRARIVAAQRNTSLSALVKKHLLSLMEEGSALRDLQQEQETLLDSIWERHPQFTTSENFSRESLYERKRA